MKMKYFGFVMLLVAFVCAGPVFSAGGGGEDESPETCTEERAGQRIFNDRGELLGCVDGGTGCTYTAVVSCD